MATREIVLTMPEVLYLQLETVAVQMQRDAAAIILDAISTYLPPMPPELTAELATWDTLSDEAFWEFERHLEATA